MATVEQHHGAYLIHGKGWGKRGTLVQTDWDYPSTAERLGWSLRRVQRGRVTGRVFTPHYRSQVLCEHRSTDGTVKCDECGLTASDFITAATDFLDSKC